jgi:hypothetical protein
MLPTFERQRQPVGTVVAERRAKCTPARLGIGVRKVAPICQTWSEVGGVEKVFDGIYQGSDRSAVRNTMGKRAQQRCPVVDDGAHV